MREAIDEGAWLSKQLLADYDSACRSRNSYAEE